MYSLPCTATALHRWRTHTNFTLRSGSGTLKLGATRTQVTNPTMLTSCRRKKQPEMEEAALPGLPAERATPAVQAAGTAVALQQPQEHRIQEGENVVLHVNSERHVVLRVKSNGRCDVRSTYRKNAELPLDLCRWVVFSRSCQLMPFVHLQPRQAWSVPLCAGRACGLPLWHAVWPCP